MKKNYIRPYIFVEGIEQENEMLAGSPQVKSDNAAGDSGNTPVNPGGTGSGDSSIGEGTGSDGLAKGTWSFWDDEDW